MFFFNFYFFFFNPFAFYKYMAAYSNLFYDIFSKLIGFSGLLALFFRAYFFSTVICASSRRIRIIFLAFGRWVPGGCGCLLPRSLLVLLYRKLKIFYFSCKLSLSAIPTPTQDILTNSWKWQLSN